MTIWPPKKGDLQRPAFRSVAKCFLRAIGAGDLMTALKPGDLLVTEEIGHHTLQPLASYFGLRLRRIAIDRAGIVPDALERFCAKNPVKAMYVMPSGLGPTAGVMTLQRRKDLPRIARKFDPLVIEKDALCPIQQDRLPPLAALAPEKVFYFTGLTKCLMPGRRVGYLVMPDRYRDAAKNRHLVMN